MTKSFTGRKRIRRDFGRIPEISRMPNLIEVQKSSYDHFLQVGVSAEARTDVGLQEVFKSVFPIRDFSDRAELLSADDPRLAGRYREAHAAFAAAAELAGNKRERDLLKRRASEALKALPT